MTRISPCQAPVHPLTHRSPIPVRAINQLQIQQQDAASYEAWWGLKAMIRGYHSPFSFLLARS